MTTSDAPDLRARFDAEIRRIADELDLPDRFLDEVEEALSSALEDPPAHRTDRTDLAFVTLDPAASTDLDQAFAIDVDGDRVVLHYAIADVGAFVRRGDPIDAEAWRRAVTVYLPGARTRLYPERLTEDAASLLPDVERPAVIFTVGIDASGDGQLESVERAVIRSRAKLAYETVTADDLPAGFDELVHRVERAEAARGARRIDRPEQVIDLADDHVTLAFRERNVLEEQSAALSLVTNVAVAKVLLASRTGLFRSMPPLDERNVRRLRHTARAIGLSWHDVEPMASFDRRLDAADPRTSAFRLAARRAAGAAFYEPYSRDRTPWHSALAATYCHVTAPMRRLADRYVIDAVLAVMRDEPVPVDVATAFERLPGAMRAGEQRAGRADRMAADLAEALMLDGRDGELFDAVVTDEDPRGITIHIVDTGIVARVDARRVDPGDRIRVRLVRADVSSRSIEFTRVA